MTKPSVIQPHALSRVKSNVGADMTPFAVDAAERRFPDRARYKAVIQPAPLSTPRVCVRLGL